MRFCLPKLRFCRMCRWFGCVCGRGVVFNSRVVVVIEGQEGVGCVWVLCYIHSKLWVLGYFIRGRGFKV